MPVTNIIDNRTNKYDVNIMVIFEDSWHDNTIKGASQFNDSIDDIDYLGIKRTTIASALRYAQEHISSEVTLYIYDIGCNNHINYDYIDENNKLVRSN